MLEPKPALINVTKEVDTQGAVVCFHAEQHVPSSVIDSCHEENVLSVAGQIASEAAKGHHLQTVTIGRVMMSK